VNAYYLKHPRVIWPLLTECLCHHSYVHIIHMYTSFIRTHHSYVRIIHTYTSFIRTHHSYVHIIHTYTSFIRTHHSYIHIMHSYTSFIRTHHSYVRIIHTYTSCIRTHHSYVHIIHTYASFIHHLLPCYIINNNLVMSCTVLLRLILYTVLHNIFHMSITNSVLRVNLI